MSSARIGIAQIPPLKFGKYTLVASLGAGGMADVFLAIATGMAGFRKLVVVKRLRKEIQEDEVYHRMLLDEARLAARLNHPNVVQTYEVAVQGDESYLAMEHLHGQSLDAILRGRRLRRDPLPVNVVTHVMAELLEGLAYAHELEDFDGTPLGVVHRDVSPGNAMITYDGVVKVLDFGLAKATTQWEDTDPDHRKGKFAYIAPEQVEGNPDARSDLFSLGVVFWEALSNRRLFAAKDPLETLKRAMAASVPPIGKDLPDGLEEVVRKALAKDPRQRYQSARAMRLALERVMRLNKLAMRRVDLSKFMKEEFEGLIDKHGAALRAAVEAGLESRGDPTLTILEGEAEIVSGSPSVPPPPRRSVPPPPPPGGGRRLGLALGPLRLPLAVAAVGLVVFSLLGLMVLASIVFGGGDDDEVAVAPVAETANTPPDDSLSGSRPQAVTVDEADETAPAEPQEQVDEETEADAGRDPLDWGPAEIEAFERQRELARVHFEAERFAEAAEAYREAARLNPAHSGSFAGIGASELAAGNVEAAVRAFQEAVRLEPTRSGFHAALGRAYREAGHLELARDSYRQAVRLDHDNDAAREGYRQVRRDLREIEGAEDDDEASAAEEGDVD